MDEVYNAKEKVTKSELCPNFDIQISCPEDLEYVGYTGVLDEITRRLIENSFVHGCMISELFVISIEILNLDITLDLYIRIMVKESTVSILI